MNEIKNINCAICLDRFPETPALEDEPVSVHTTLSSSAVHQFLQKGNGIDGKEGHIFHSKCINSLVDMGDSRCPICRVDMIAFSGKAKIRALAAVSRDGSALEEVSPELQNDRDVVLAAIRQNVYALRYASPDLQNGREVVLAAVRQNGYALGFASPELQSSPNLFM